MCILLLETPYYRLSINLTDRSTWHFAFEWFYWVTLTLSQEEDHRSEKLEWLKLNRPTVIDDINPPWTCGSFALSICDWLSWRSVVYQRQHLELQVCIVSRMSQITAQWSSRLANTNPRRRERCNPPDSESRDVSDGASLLWCPVLNWSY